MEKDGEIGLDSPEHKRRSGRDAGRETINGLNNNCKKEKELDLSRDERKELVDGSDGGQNGGQEDKRSRGRKRMGMLKELYKKVSYGIIKKRTEDRIFWKCLRP